MVYIQYVILSLENLVYRDVEMLYKVVSNYVIVL